MLPPIEEKARELAQSERQKARRQFAEMVDTTLAMVPAEKRAYWAERVLRSRTLPTVMTILSRIRLKYSNKQEEKHA